MAGQSTHSRSPFRSLQLSLLAVLPFSMHGPSPPLLQCSSKAAAGNPPTDRPRPDSLDQEEKKKKRNPTCLTQQCSCHDLQKLRFSSRFWRTIPITQPAGYEELVRVFKRCSGGHSAGQQEEQMHRQGCDCDCDRDQRQQ